MGIMTKIFLLNTKTAYATDTVGDFTGIVAVTGNVWYCYVASVYGLSSYTNSSSENTFQQLDWNQNQL